MGWPAVELSEEEAVGETDSLGVPEVVPLGVSDGVPDGVPDGVSEGVPDGVPLGVSEGVPDGVPEGVPVGVGVVAGVPGHVCDRLNLFCGTLPEMVASAETSLASIAEATYACLPSGLPKALKSVIVCVPPGSKVTVSLTKSPLLPGRTKCQPSWVEGMPLQSFSWLPNWSAVRGAPGGGSGEWCHRPRRWRPEPVRESRRRPRQARRRISGIVACAVVHLG